MGNYKLYTIQYRSKRAAKEIERMRRRRRRRRNDLNYTQIFSISFSISSSLDFNIIFMMCSVDHLENGMRERESEQIRGPQSNTNLFKCAWVCVYAHWTWPSIWQSKRMWCDVTCIRVSHTHTYISHSTMQGPLSMIFGSLQLTVIATIAGAAAVTATEYTDTSRTSTRNMPKIWKSWTAKVTTPMGKKSYIHRSLWISAGITNNNIVTDSFVRVFVYIPVHTLLAVNHFMLWNLLFLCAIKFGSRCWSFTHRFNSFCIVQHAFSIFFKMFKLRMYNTSHDRTDIKNVTCHFLSFRQSFECICAICVRPIH